MHLLSGQQNLRGDNVKKVVIFDMDGLMFDTERVVYEANIDAFAEQNLKLSKEEYFKFIGRTDPEIQAEFRRLAGSEELGNKIWDRANSKYWERINTSALQKKEGLNQILDTLSAHDIDCYVASSSLRADVEKLLKQTQVDYYIKGIIGGDEITHSKPHPEIFEKALALTGHAAEDAIVLEDSLAGVEAAYRAGIDVVMIPDLVEPDEETFKQVVAVVPTLTDALPFILNSCK